MADKQTYLSLPDQLSELDDGAEYSGSFDIPTMTVGPDTWRFQAPLSWDVTVTHPENDMLLFTGTIEGRAETDCSRCLEPFELDLDGEIEGYVFRVDPGDNLPEGVEEGEYLVLDDRRGVDIAPFLTAALTLAVPLVPLHDDDCAGLCPNCGANLNEGPCDCSIEPDPDFEVAANPFAALKNYHFEN